MTRRTRQRPAQPTREARSTCLATTAARLAGTVHPHGPLPDGPAVDADVPQAGPGWIQGSVRLLRRRGLSTVEASNVVAYVAGLHPAPDGWTVREIERLVALRTLAACGVVPS